MRELDVGLATFVAQVLVRNIAAPGVVSVRHRRYIPGSRLQTRGTRAPRRGAGGGVLRACRHGSLHLSGSPCPAHIGRIEDGRSGQARRGGSQAGSYEPTRHRVRARAPAIRGGGRPAARGNRARAPSCPARSGWARALLALTAQWASSRLTPPRSRGPAVHGQTVKRRALLVGADLVLSPAPRRGQRLPARAD